MMCSKWIQGIVQRNNQYKAIIFMLHRFDSEAHKSHGHSPEFLRQCIRYLKSNGREIVPLDTLIMSLRGEIPPIRNAVAFTLDDGYTDQAEIGLPIFIKENIPATICLITEFVSQRYWLAESRIAYILESTEKKFAHVNFLDNSFEINLSDKERLKNERKRLIYFCKKISLKEVEKFIVLLSKNLAVEVPKNPPIGYSALTWDDAKKLEKRNIFFAAHTCKHPSLLREDRCTAEDEILSSIERIKSELESPSKVFFYPTGRLSLDFSEREMSIIRKANFIGAVSAEPGYVELKSKPDDLYSIPRFSFPDSTSDFKEIVHHITHIKDVIYTRLYKGK